MRRRLTADGDHPSVEGYRRPRRAGGAAARRDLPRSGRVIEVRSGVTTITNSIRTIVLIRRHDVRAVRGNRRPACQPAARSRLPPRRFRGRPLGVRRLGRDRRTRAADQGPDLGRRRRRAALGLPVRAVGRRRGLRRCARRPRRGHPSALRGLRGRCADRARARLRSRVGHGPAARAHRPARARFRDLPADGVRARATARRERPRAGGERAHRDRALSGLRPRAARRWPRVLGRRARAGDGDRRRDLRARRSRRPRAQGAAPSGPR